MKNPFGRFGITTVSVYVVAASLAIATVVSCGDKKKEESKFPRADTPQAIEPGELTSFRLANGITVYLQEEHSDNEIAVETIYYTGVMNEGEGQLQVSRVMPHMLIFSPTASFEADQAVQKVEDFGRINGEVTGLFTHFDYIVPTGELDLVLQIESERLTSIEFNEEQLKEYAEKCKEDLDLVLEREQLSLVKYGLMAFNQAYNYGKKTIPIHAGADVVTLDDLRRFHQQQYRLDKMVIVVIGDFDTAEATELIKKRFENITQAPLPPAEPVTPIAKDWTAQWDIDANVIFLIFPGPYENERERLVLTMFGTFLNQQLRNNVNVYEAAKSSYCSNQTYPVDGLPFFVFVEARTRKNLSDLKSEVLLGMTEAMQETSEKMFDAMKSNMVYFVESSMLTSPRNLATVSHYRVIGQEALNVGMKHYLREGHSTEEFVELVRSITYEEAKQYIESRLTMDNMKTVIIKGE